MAINAVPFDKARELVREQIRATAEVVKAVNSGKGRVSKRKDTRERRAAAVLFGKLTGLGANEADIDFMVGY